MNDTLQGAAVLITGAAMGMGKLYAHKAAAAGATTLHLWDINADALTDCARELGKRYTAIHIQTRTIDLTDTQAISKACADINAAHPQGIDVLINNAGIVPGNDYLWQQDDAAAERCMALNSLAPIQLTQALLPNMIGTTTRRRYILNIASAAATVANPRMAVYCASKWAMLGFSDSLRLELRQAGHTHLSVTTFCPSYISTGMFDGAKGMLLTPIMTPEQAVGSAWQAMLGGKAIIYKPWSVRLGIILKALLPVRLWDWLAQHILGIYTSMSDFKGRR